MSVNDDILLVVISNAVDGTLCSYLPGKGTLSPYRQTKSGDKVMPLALLPDGNAFIAHTRGEEKALLYYCPTSLDDFPGNPVHTPVADNLVYIAVSAQKSFLYGVSYDTGQLIVYDLLALQRGESRVVAVANDIPHAHCVAMSPDERFVYVSSLTTGRIFIFRWQQQTLIASGSILIAPDFGPRHLRLHALSSTLYVISEFQGRVAALHIDAQTGLLSLDSLAERPASLAHLQDGFARPGATAAVQPDPASLANRCWAAEIQVTADARFIYTTERTSSRILLWRRDERGQLACSFWTETQTQPRSIKLTPCDGYLISSGEKSASISLYRIDKINGELHLLAQYPGGQGANCIEIVSLRAG